MRRPLATLSILVVVGFASCGDEGPADASSGIRGRALAGPQCPVEVAGSPCPDRPWEGVVVATNAETGERTSVRTGGDGRFAIALDPGTYELTIRSDGGPPTARPQTVSVVAGAYTDVTVAVDTGIR